MTLDKALEITMIRKNELSRISLSALNDILKRTKAEKDNDYTQNKYTRKEYITAYETIRNHIQRGEH